MCIDTRRFADGNNFKSCVTLTFCFCHFLGKFNPWLILFGFFHTFWQFDFVLVVVIQIGNIFFSIDKLYHNSYLHCISTNWTFSSRNAFTVLLKMKKKTNNLLRGTLMLLLLCYRNSTVKWHHRQCFIGRIEIIQIKIGGQTRWNILCEKCRFCDVSKPHLYRTLLFRKRCRCSYGCMRNAGELCKIIAQFPSTFAQSSICPEYFSVGRRYTEKHVHTGTQGGRYCFFGI